MNYAEGAAEFYESYKTGLQQAGAIPEKYNRLKWGVISVLSSSSYRRYATLSRLAGIVIGNLSSQFALAEGVPAEAYPTLLRIRELGLDADPTRWAWGVRSGRGLPTYVVGSLDVPGSASYIMEWDRRDSLAFGSIKALDTNGREYGTPVFIRASRVDVDTDTRLGNWDFFAQDERLHLKTNRPDNLALKFEPFSLFNARPNLEDNKSQYYIRVGSSFRRDAQ